MLKSKNRIYPYLYVYFVNQKTTKNIAYIFILPPQKMPILSKIAIRTINFPVSNCTVERSFSIYRCILTDRRRKLLKENIKEYIFFYVNKEEIKNNLIKF